MKLKYIRLNLQEILIIDVSEIDKYEGRPVGAIQIGNETIFLKRGIYYSKPNYLILAQIVKDLPDVVKPDWKILYSPDSFGLNEWDDETQSHLSLGEISYRHLPKADKDARKVDTNALPGVKPIRLTGEFPEWGDDHNPEEIEESH